MSGGAEMTIAFAPSKRVTTALRPPVVAAAARRRARTRRPARRGARGLPVRGSPPCRSRAAGAEAAEPGPGRRGRGCGRLADHLLEHRQQLLGVGMIEEDDADLAAVRGAPVEIPGDRGELGHRRGVAPEGDRVGAVDRDHRHALGRELGQRRGDLARAAIVEADDPGRLRIDVDPRQHLADPGDIVGEVGNDDRAAAGGDRAVAADHRPQRLDRGRGIDVADPENLGDEARGARPPPDRRASPPRPATGWIRSAPPATGTATKPLARSVDRNSSKYSERDSGRSVTTETRPCTPGSMMKVRPVTREASWMKARMSASRRFSTCCAEAGVTAAQASARAIKARFTGSPSPSTAPPARPDRPSP